MGTIVSQRRPPSRCPSRSIVSSSSCSPKMPLNVPGILVPFQLLLHPRLVIPSFVVKGIYFYKFSRSLLTVMDAGRHPPD